MTLVKEDGTGKADANTYADMTDANAYAEKHLYATTWTDATPDDKKAALAMATRMLDANMDWRGYRTTTVQALDWPRIYVPDDRFSPYYYVRDPLAPITEFGVAYPSNAVPVELVNATAEQALELLKSNRTADWSAMGVQSIGLGQGAVDVSFTPGAEKLVQPLAKQVTAMLTRFGDPKGSRAQARVRRG